MSYSNANYLINPNKLSTKVHYAPGGASSLSLAWDNTPMPSRQDRLCAQNPYFKQQTEPMQNYSPIIQQRHPEQRPSGNYYQPQSQQYPSGNDNPNRNLEAELHYYQNKNKQLQNNILGGNYEQYQEQQYSQNYPTIQYTNQHTPNHYAPNQYSRSIEKPHYQHLSPQAANKYSQRPQELDLAVQQHRKRQQSVSIQQYGPYLGSNTEKTSVRVNNPPGGRSNIVFG